MKTLKGSDKLVWTRTLGSEGKCSGGFPRLYFASYTPGMKPKEPLTQNANGHRQKVLNKSLLFPARGPGKGQASKIENV